MLVARSQAEFGKPSAADWVAGGACEATEMLSETAEIRCRGLQPDREEWVCRVQITTSVHTDASSRAVHVWIGDQGLHATSACPPTRPSEVQASRHTSGSMPTACCRRSIPPPTARLSSPEPVGDGVV